MNQTCTEAELDEIIQRSVEHQGAQRASVIPILSEINEALGYIPIEALGKIRRQINSPEEGLFLADSQLVRDRQFLQHVLAEAAGQTCDPFLRERTLPCGRCQRSNRCDRGSPGHSSR